MIFKVLFSGLVFCPIINIKKHFIGIKKIIDKIIKFINILFLIATLNSLVRNKNHFFYQ